MTTKSLRTIQRNTRAHWVGDGFPVRTLFAYPSLGHVLSPFLLLDYAGPVEFEPTTERRGVGEHPHRGFETVTIVYAGEVEHRDSSGGGGKIGPGDVQWMTAASGVVHEEFHGREFAARGGRFELVQLWVNLPARAKSMAPRYQGILSEQIPVVPLGASQGTARVIAGPCGEVVGPAETVTPMAIWDLRLDTASPLTLAVPAGHSAALVVLSGSVTLPDGQSLGSAEVAVFEQAGADIALASASGATALLLTGEPLNEPIAGGGPFVMNTAEEIQQAMHDYQSGKMGHL